MAHVSPAERAFPQSVIYLFAAALVTVAVVAIVALSALGPIRLGGAVVDSTPVKPELLEAARQWELERKQQMGYVDPVLDAGREWERQRRQQAGES